METNNQAPTDSASRQFEKTCLIVDDDQGIIAFLRKRLALRYPMVEFLFANNGGEALAILKQSPRIDAIILDIMMPYGRVEETLNGEADPDEIETGLHLLEWVRKQENWGTSIWVSLLTARSPYAVDSPAKELLGDHGQIYYKPFDSNRFENDLMGQLGIESLIPKYFFESESEGEAFP